MKHVALVTCSTYPHLSQSDALLVEPLKKEGFIAHAVPWDAPGINWNMFDIIILRSCWNYPGKYIQFIDWITSIHGRLYNPASLVKWNSHKSYLLDLEKLGVPIIPSIMISKNRKMDIPWSNVVVKPAVGADAHGVSRNIKNINLLLKKGDCIVQELANEVITQGEYSFVFIGNTITHCVLKTPKKGDFRANAHLGAVEKIVIPAAELAQQAKAILLSVKTNLLYARVDCVNRNGKLLLMELELIEPHLFFNYSKRAAALFARTLKQYER